MQALNATHCTPKNCENITIHIVCLFYNNINIKRKKKKRVQSWGSTSGTPSPHSAEWLQGLLTSWEWSPGHAVWLFKAQQCGAHVILKGPLTQK